MTVSGALRGATLRPLARYGDLQNKTSIGTAAVYVGKALTKENTPYYREYTNGVIRIHMTYHFLVEVRRQLSGNIEEGSSRFSPEETKFYNDYVEWNDEITKYGETLQALEEFDKWLVDEIMGLAHEELNRDYEEDHKWTNLEVDEDQEYAEDHPWNKVKCSTEELPDDHPWNKTKCSEPTSIFKY